ncbi:hypothetical protein ACP70R_001413 [Stipagrostis hirtigluma subsp. patula]
MAGVRVKQASTELGVPLPHLDCTALCRDKMSDAAGSSQATKPKGKNARGNRSDPGWRVLVLHYQNWSLLISHREAAMEKEDESDLDQDVENIVQNLTEACADELGLDQNFDDGAFVEGDEGEEDYHGEEDCSTGGHDTSGAASTSATLPELESVNLDDLY